MSGGPWLWPLAGPNGAGKSTYAPNVAADVGTIVQPDELVDDPSPRTSKTAVFQAGRLAVRRTIELLEQRHSFAIETTLSGRRHIKLIERAKREGWSVGLVYIGLGSPELAIERVRQRVNQGGHDVPAADVERRYERSLKNLAAVFKLVDRVMILDNSSLRNRMKPVLEVYRGNVVFKARRLPKWLKAPV